MRVLLTSTHANGSTPVIVHGARQDILHNVVTPVTDDQLHVLQNATLEGITLTEIPDEEAAAAPAEAAPTARRRKPATPAPAKAEEPATEEKKEPAAPFDPGKFAPVTHAVDAVIGAAKALSADDLASLINHLETAKRPRAKLIEGLKLLQPKEE